MEKYYCANCDSLIKQEYNYCTTCGIKLVATNIIRLSSLNFCSRCMDETIPESTGNLQMYNFIGTTIISLGRRCNICNSFVAKKCLVFGGIPINSFGNFRILKISESGFYINWSTTYLSRKIKNQISVKS